MTMKRHCNVCDDTKPKPIGVGAVRQRWISIFPEDENDSIVRANHADLAEALTGDYCSGTCLLLALMRHTDPPTREQVPDAWTFFLGPQR